MLWLVDGIGPSGLKSHFVSPVGFVLYELIQLVLCTLTSIGSESLIS